ncbi:MAG: NADH-quinone oxidoreductase subunit [Frankiales bacterium]|nr:NADH-quinone oxidoreductase subunit [Frankiales bacterium]
MIAATSAQLLGVGHTSGAEAATFWVLGPIAVIAAIGMVATRRAVHAALLLAVDMIALAVLYAAQDAPFLAFVQIFVYTGAVMMLFLFVLMLVGVDASDSLIETLRGQRIAALVLALGFAALLIGGIGNALVDTPAKGIADANADGNPTGLARILFTRYVFAFEVTSALLITAALGAMVLTHRERIGPRITQRDRMQARVREGARLTPLPSPGVYARHNAVDVPALQPDGSPAPESLPGLLSGGSAPDRRIATPAVLGPESESAGEPTS